MDRDTAVRLGQQAIRASDHRLIEALSIASSASSALTGHQRVEIAERCNRHGTRLAYRRFPPWLMRGLAWFSEEVVYPLRYAQWCHARGNAYDFAGEA